MRVKLAAFILIVLWATAVSVAAQASELTLGEPDTSDFPIIKVNVQTSGANNAPLSEADLGNLRLRENGVPISNFDLRFVPNGVDVIFVLDVDSTILLPDVDEMTRLEMVRESIGRYASRFMSPSGLDRVSVIVPDRANSGGQFLLQDAATAEAVSNALADYSPQNLPEEGPINQQIVAALDHAADIQVDGRYQAIFVLSEARRLSQFLDYPVLVETAQAGDVLVFVGILGPEASLEDIGNASALADPTGGFYVHTPRAERADPVYLRWQQESNQPQISYRSLINESGTYPIAVNIGQVSASTDLDITILPPVVDLALNRSVIRRAGTAVDTPLLDLQPTIQPVPVQISWPDERPRRLTAVTFTVNNVPQPFLELPQPDENGLLQLDWNVQNADVGVYELAVEIEDELGFTAVTEPQIVTISVDRPDPPTPTPAPTATPKPIEQVVELADQPRELLLMALAAAALIGLVLVMLRAVKRYRQRVQRQQARSQRRAALQRIQEEQTAVDPSAETEPMQAALLLLDETLKVKERYPLAAENVLIGRDETAQIVVTDRSISPLHARVRLRNWRYWLYDEGSENGTYLNHMRLGLSPQLLKDKDDIRLGQINFRFELKPLSAEADEVDAAAEQAAAAADGNDPASDEEAEDLNQQQGDEH